jgi:hypothetical protein
MAALMTFTCQKCGYSVDCWGDGCVSAARPWQAPVRQVREPDERQQVQQVRDWQMPSWPAMSSGASRACSQWGHFNSMSGIAGSLLPGNVRPTPVPFQPKA